MLRQAMNAAVVVLLTAIPSVADAAVMSKTVPTEARSQRGRRDGIRPPPPPLCDDAVFCDWTKPFRFQGGMAF